MNSPTLFQMLLYTASPSPRLGFATPLKTAIWLSDKNVGKFAHSFSSTVGSKNVAKKNELSGGTSFVGC